MASMRDCTVVAVFDDVSEARAAASELKTAGLGSDKVYVSSENTPAGSNAGYTPHHEGGFTGWVKSLFGGEEHDHGRSYETAVAGGKTVVSIDTTEANADRASEILSRHSPVDVHTDDFGAAHGVATSDTHSAGYAGSRSDVLNARDELDTAAGSPGSFGHPAGRPVDTNAAPAIPVVHEELKVGKRDVQTGGVRVYSRMTDTPVEQDVNLRQEHVRVDRQPVDRAATDADLRAGRDQVIEVSEYGEEPVVAKQARVVEEVRVNKDASERTETVRDSVRQSDVQVENLADRGNRPNGQTSAYDSDFRKHFAATYPANAANYDDYAPAYRYGYEAASDPRYAGRDYSQVESDLRSDYGRRYPNSAWDRMKDSIRYGWDKMTGKAQSATSR